jgi:predicted flavoprotein YhiN
MNLVDFILTKSAVSLDRKISELNKKEEEKLIENLVSLKLLAVGTDGFKKAIVTSGGVELKEVNRQTLEAKKIKNLFFAGEVLDVDGRCGGYNLTWAFASGAQVAAIIGERVEN